MKVAVLMSTYNGEEFIREQIESILTQRGDFELTLWIRDDGSTDQTQKILDEYASKGLLHWYSGMNIGPAKSFIELIRHCKGYEFYAFADQDDLWLQGKVDKGIYYLSNCERPAIYLSNARIVGVELNDLGREVYHSIPKTDFYTLACAGGLLGCTMIFNHMIAKMINDKPMPEKVVMHDFYLALVCRALDGVIYYDNIPSMKYRQHSNNVIGISHGTLRIIESRLKSMFRKAPISVAEQAESVLKNYQSVICPSYIEWLEKVAHYRENIGSRWALAFNKKIKYVNINIAVKNIVALLLANR